MRDPLLGRNVDWPTIGPTDGQELLVSGWALCREGPLRAIWITAAGKRVARVRADRPRPDIAAAFADHAHAGACGFRALVPFELARHLGELEIAVERDGEPLDPIWRLSLAPQDGEVIPAILEDDFRVLALISTYNEADIIEAVLDHLWCEGVWSYVIDDGSTDGTVAAVRACLGRGAIGIEQLHRDPAARTSWRAILARKLALADDLGADWYMHHDADEIRESPWPGVTLRRAIQSIDNLGFNSIEFRVLNFPPVDDTFRAGDDPRTHFTRWEEPAEYDRVQRKCWKADARDVRLEEGGHDVRFENRSTFPIRFLLRHYPLRSQAHGRRKVWHERKNRFDAEEIASGWHRQYDHVATRDHLFLRNPASLRPFDLDQVRLQTVLEDGHRAATDGPLLAESAPSVTRWRGARGVLERVTPEAISGWAASDDGCALAVQVWDGPRLIATTPAEQPRADLTQRDIPGGGFTLRTPRELLDGRPHWIWASIAGTDVALRRSPTVLHHGGRTSIAPPGIAA